MRTCVIGFAGTSKRALDWYGTTVQIYGEEYLKNYRTIGPIHNPCWFQNLLSDGRLSRRYH